MLRTIMALCLLLAPALFFLWDWPLPDPLSISSVLQTSIESPVEIPVSRGNAEFKIDFQQHSHYLLIVSTLGVSGETWDVELTARSGKLQGAQKLEVVTALPELPQWGSNTLSQETEFVSFSGPVAGEPSREFHLHVTDGPLDNPIHYARVQASLIAEGESVRIYLDSQISENQLKRGLVTELIRLFDQEILPKSQNSMGDYSDVDGDGKFAILLSPWLERLQGGKTSLGGFVRASDFQPGVKKPFSNQCDVLYLNSKLAPGPELRTLLAHEFAHAVCVSQRLREGSAFSGMETEEDWLNEAIAHLAENLHSRDFSNIDYRISRFLHAPQDYRLVVPDYYRSGLWRNHGCRGVTYLFLRWCVDTYGEELLTRLIHSPLSGRKNLERATGRSFEELYRHFTIALWQSSPGRSANTEQAGEGQPLRWLSLDEAINQYQLCGPRPVRWDLYTPHCSVKLQSTSTAFVVLKTSGTTAVHMQQLIRVRTAPEAKLQLTLLPLNGYRTLPVRAEYKPASPLSGELNQMVRGDNLHPQLPISLNVCLPEECELQAISLEYHDGDTHRATRFSGEELEHFRMERAENTNHREESYRLPGFREPAFEQTWQIKVLATDRSGKTIAGWGEVVVPAQHPFPLERTASGTLPAYR